MQHEIYNRDDGKCWRCALAQRGDCKVFAHRYTQKRELSLPATMGGTVYPRKWRNFQRVSAGLNRMALLYGAKVRAVPDDEPCVGYLCMTRDFFELFARDVKRLVTLARHALHMSLDTNQNGETEVYIYVDCFTDAVV